MDRFFDNNFVHSPTRVVKIKDDYGGPCAPFLSKFLGHFDNKSHNLNSIFKIENNVQTIINSFIQCLFT